MATAIHLAPRPPEDGSELRRDEAQQGPPLPLTLDTLLEAAPARSAFPPSSANVQTHEPSRDPSSPSSVPPNRQRSSTPGRLNTFWKYVWNEIRIRKHREAFLSVVSFVALVMAGVTFWPAITAASDGYKSRLLTEWSVRKEFISNCKEVGKHLLYHRQSYGY